MPTTIQEEGATRSSLLGRAENPDDATAWQEFDRRYRRLIMAVAQGQGLSREEAEDVTQETLSSVAAGLSGFEYDPVRCRFRTWLRTLTSRRIADHFRRRAGSEPGPLPVREEETGMGTIPLADGTGNPLEARWEAEWRAAIVEMAWKRLRDEVKPLAYQVLHLRLREERSFTEISHALGLSLNRVYLARMRAGRVFQRLVNTARREAECLDQRVIRSAAQQRQEAPGV